MVESIQHIFNDRLGNRIYVCYDKVLFLSVQLGTEEPWSSQFGFLVLGQCKFRRLLVVESIN